jgi:hypothetical protein
LWHRELNERLSDEYRWRPSGDQCLVVQLHPQFLLLCLEKLDLLIELVMQKILGLLLRLQ